MSEFSIITVGRTPIGRARSPWRRPFLKQPRHVLALLVAAPFLAGAVAAIALGWRDMPPARIYTPSEVLIAGAGSPACSARTCCWFRSP